MKRLIFKHFKHPDKGCAVGIRIGKFTYKLWLGYGKPIWWIPKFIGKGNAKYGFGFGWLLLCLRIQISVTGKVVVLHSAR